MQLAWLFEQSAPACAVGSTYIAIHDTFERTKLMSTIGYVVAYQHPVPLGRALVPTLQGPY